jgi:hypothetical protein
VEFKKKIIAGNINVQPGLSLSIASTLISEFRAACDSPSIPAPSKLRDIMVTENEGYVGHDVYHWMSSPVSWQKLPFTFEPLVLALCYGVNTCPKR